MYPDQDLPALHNDIKMLLHTIEVHHELTHVPLCIADANVYGAIDASLSVNCRTVVLEYDVDVRGCKRKTKHWFVSNTPKHRQEVTVFAFSCQIHAQNGAQIQILT